MVPRGPNTIARPVDHVHDRQRRRRALRSPQSRYRLRARCTRCARGSAVSAGGGARDGQLGLPPYLYTTYLITSIEPNPERHSTIFRQENSAELGRVGEDDLPWSQFDST
jgi:hypothetical protein